MTRDELKQKANKLELEFPVNISSEKLENLVEEAEIKKKASGYEVAKKTDKAKVPDKVDMRKEALKMKRVIITPLDERMRTLPSEMFSVGNQHIGFIKKVVRFNKETLEPQIVLDLLETKQVLIQETTVVNGKPTVKKRMGSAYSIKYLPDLTEEEFKALKEESK